MYTALALNLAFLLFGFNPRTVGESLALAKVFMCFNFTPIFNHCRGETSKRVLLQSEVPMFCKSFALACFLRRRITTVWHLLTPGVRTGRINIHISQSCLPQHFWDLFNSFDFQSFVQCWTTPHVTGTHYLTKESTTKSAMQHIIQVSVYSWGKNWTERWMCLSANFQRRGTYDFELLVAIGLVD